MPRRRQDADPEAQNEILRQHQATLTHIARDAADPGTLDTFLEGVARRVSTALEIDHVKILRHRPETDDLFVEAGIGWHDGVVKVAAFGTDLASPGGRAFQTGHPVVIEDIRRSPDFQISRVLEEHDIHSLINVPIFIDDAVWGILEADSSRLRGFSDDTVLFMQAAAALISLQIRRNEAEAARALALAATAEEMRRREVLLSELQHRVKNYFQIMLAMINLRKPQFTTEHSRALATQIEQGIMAMALAHAQLEPTRSGEMLALGNYLRALTRNLEKAVEKVSIELDLNEVQVPVEQAAPIGLIVNELFTNAVKHAFGADGGCVFVQLQSHGKDGQVQLTVADNGRGVPEAVKRGSGIRLVRSLADQLRGTVEYETPPRGTRVRLCFYPKTSDR